MARLEQSNVAARVHQFIGAGEPGEATTNDDHPLGSAPRTFSEPARTADQDPDGSRQRKLQELPAIKRRGRFVPPGQVCEEGSRHIRVLPNSLLSDTQCDMMPDSASI
jgi:hypothetical protein